MDDEDRYTRITFRIPKNLHGLLSRQAEESSKSLNAEIVARLQQSFGVTHAPATDESWQWDMKRRTSELRLETAQGQIRSVKMHGDLLHMRLPRLKAEQASTESVQELIFAISNNQHELVILQTQYRKLLDKDVALIRQHDEWNRPRLKEIDQAAKATLHTPDQLLPSGSEMPSKPRQTAVPLVGTVGDGETKATAKTSATQRLKEAINNSQKPYGRQR